MSGYATQISPEILGEVQTIRINVDQSRQVFEAFVYWSELTDTDSIEDYDATGTGATIQEAIEAALTNLATDGMEDE